MNKNKIIVVIGAIVVLLISTFNVGAGVSVYHDDWKLEISSSPNSTEYYVDGYSGTETSVEIPSEVFDHPVSGINDYAFLNNTVLEYCVIPDTVKVVGDGAFYGCTNLKGIVIPDSVEELGVNTFYNCSSLISVDMRADTGVKEIKTSCFNKCTSLESFTVAQGVERIGDFAFLNCVGLNTVVVPPTVNFISSSAFMGCDSLTLYGWDNTYTQQYAEEMGIPFVSYGEYTEPTEPPVTTETTLPEETTEPSTSGGEIPSETVEPSTDTEEKPSESTEPSTSGEDKPTVPVVKGLLGDANVDGKVNIRDATAIQKHIAGLITLSETGFVLADVDASGNVNVKDATAIQKHIAGIETGYKIGIKI